ncbi:tripartite motif-containing protein 16-like [Diretmus argenteus]
MAEQQQQQHGGVLDLDQLCCSVCLDLLKDPVTINCGHSYCRSCMEGCWDLEEEKGVFSCPQCRESFSPRPVLRRNNVLAEILENLKTTGGQQASPSAALVYAGPAEVACDFCTGTRRNKAAMSCLTCMASYCEIHLQPHYSVPKMQQHKLVSATARLQEETCSSHDKLMEVYCRTDQQCVCYLCTLDEHKGHNTVSVAAERAEKQKQLSVSQQTVQKRVQERERELKELSEAVEDLKSSAQTAVQACETIFTELIRSIERRLSEVKQLIRAQEKTAVSQAEELLLQLEEEIARLRRRDTELEELSHTDHHIHFIQCVKVFVSKMAEQQQQYGGVLDLNQLRCSVCLDLLKDPVTINCGHSYCRSCMEGCWDLEEETGVFRCPQCRESFRPRPVLRRNNVLAEILENLKTTGGQQASPSAALVYAGPADVASDFCTGTRRNKAAMSCLTCMASYCEIHLQPHYSVPKMQKHKLVSATARLQEETCSIHDKLMEVYCRTDQQCVCLLCTLDEHKGHNTVSVAAERAEKQKQLSVSQQTVQKRVPERERELKELSEAVEDLKSSAQTAVQACDTIFTELIRSIERRLGEVKQLIRAQEKTAVSQAEELLLQLEEEIARLRRRDTELEELSHTDHHIHFIQSFQSLSSPSGSPDLPGIVVQPLRFFRDVSDSVSDLRDELEKILKDTWPRISTTVSRVDVLLPPEPKTREDFLQYCCPLTFDVNSVSTGLSLSENNHKVTRVPKKISYPDHPDRFTKYYQVLCREGLSGRCYWEFEWKGYNLDAAVSYKDIRRTGADSLFGDNDKSWSLRCYQDRYSFRHNNVSTEVSGPCSSRVGVYLDHEAGTLSFYSVSDTMTLLHKVCTTFTQPLYPGIYLSASGAFAELIKLW